MMNDDDNSYFGNQDPVTASPVLSELLLRRTASWKDVLEAVLVAVSNDATSNTTITTHDDDFYDWYRGEGG